MNNKKRLLLILIPVILVVVSLVIIIFAYINSINAKYDSQIRINNYSGLVKNLPDERRDAIFSSLYKAVEQNLPNKSVPNIDDATIREGSAVQDQPAGSGRYSGSFTVDIESIKQSYGIVYSYSSNADDDFMVDYNLVVRCLPVEDLKFGDFGCKDIFTQEDVVADPIQRVLPRTTLEYAIEYIDLGEDGESYLQITLYLTDADKYNKQQSIDTYKTMALDWLESQNIDTTKYTINYIY